MELSSLWRSVGGVFTRVADFVFVAVLPIKVFTALKFITSNRNFAVSGSAVMKYFLQQFREMVSMTSVVSVKISDPNDTLLSNAFSVSIRWEKL